MTDKEVPPSYDEDRLYGLCEKAKRLILNPLERALAQDPIVKGAQLQRLAPEILAVHAPCDESEAWAKGLHQMQGRLGQLARDESVFDLDATAKSFPMHANEEYRGDPRYCAWGLARLSVVRVFGTDGFVS